VNFSVLRSLKIDQKANSQHFFKYNLPVPVKAKRHPDRRLLQKREKHSEFNEREGDKDCSLHSIVFEYGATNNKLGTASLKI